MLRTAFISVGLLALAACGQALFDDSDRLGNGDYEVVTLIAE